jgi:glucose-1-phosphate thymidylyltransferase
VTLAAEQETRAERGEKGMIPVGRPFLDYVLSGLADAGLLEVCLVIGPEHRAIRAYYTGAGRPSRVSLHFAVQAQPLGTADAVLATEAFAAGRSLIVLNADNLYPLGALRELIAMPRAGLVAFRRSALLRNGDIPPERINRFALIESRGGRLVRIVEKPDERTAAGFGADPLVSMNLWLLPPTIFASCRAIEPSERGELELQDAIRHNIDVLGETYAVGVREEPVLDLSTRGDVPRVTARLSGIDPTP